MDGIEMGEIMRDHRFTRSGKMTTDMDNKVVNE